MECANEYRDQVSPKGGPDGIRPNAIICDVDGTLCDVRSVRHHVEGPPGSTKFKRNFDRFHKESAGCPAFPQVVGLLQRAYGAGYAVVIVTAREAKWFDLTSQWLSEQGVEYDALLMRPRSDFRPDTVIKVEIARQIWERYYPRLAIDDRLDIVKVWRQARIPTSLVSPEGVIGPAKWPKGFDPDSHARALVAGLSLG